MGVKYVKDFEFSKDAGFSGSCAPMKKAMGGKVDRSLNRIMDAVRRSPQAQQMMADSMQGPEMAGAPMEQQPTMMRKGGKVTGKKAQAKVGKVMREFKEGKLHSGKDGPVVKNPKQAMAIALSEARRMKKADGGEVKKPKKEESKKPKMKVEDEALKKMRHAEKYAPGMDLDNIHDYEIKKEMKESKKVEKYQQGGIARMRPPEMGRIVDPAPPRAVRGKPSPLSPDRLAAKRAANAAKRQAAYEARMSAARARRGVSDEKAAANRAANAAKRQAAYDARIAASKARLQPGKDAFKARMEAARARRAARGMKEGGEVHSDVKMDKAMMKKAVHKHEKAMHPGKPLTKLKRGGLPVHQGSPMYGKK